MRCKEEEDYFKAPRYLLIGHCGVLIIWDGKISANVLLWFESN